MIRHEVKSKQRKIVCKDFICQKKYNVKSDKVIVARSDGRVGMGVSE